MDDTGIINPIRIGFEWRQAVQVVLDPGQTIRISARYTAADPSQAFSTTSAVEYVDENEVTLVIPAPVTAGIAYVPGGAIVTMRLELFIVTGGSEVSSHIVLVVPAAIPAVTASIPTTKVDTNGTVTLPLDLLASERGPRGYQGALNDDSLSVLDGKIEEAEAARDAAAGALAQVIGLASIYPDTATGLAATAAGGYFSVAGTGDTFLTLYRDVGGVAVLQNVYYTKAAVDAQVALALGYAASALNSSVSAQVSAATAGVYINAAATNVPRGLVGAAISNAGSGMANGLDKVVTWAGGNMIGNPVVWFDVVGGVMTNVRVKDPGLYIGASISLPTATIPGAAGGAALTFTTGFRIGSGSGYWVQSADFNSLLPYKNISGVATAETGIDAIPTMSFTAANQPINDKDLMLERRLGLMTTNTTNLGVTQTDGTIAISAGTPTITWDYILTAADLAAGTVTVDWLEISSGLTFTVEQRSASAQTVAPVTVPLRDGRRTITLSPNTGLGTTILRLQVAGSLSASVRSFGVPSVTAKRPLTVPSDPNYFALIAERLMASDGAQISTLSLLSSGSGAAVIDTNSFSMPANADISGTFGLSKNMKQDFVVLVTIASTNLRPQLVDLYPIAIGGTEGSVIPTRQYRFAGKPNQFIVSVPYQVGGVPVIGFRIRGYTYANGSINGGAIAEALTISARAYDAASLPALRTVPTAVTKAIADAGTATLATAATARELAIDKSLLTAGWQNEITRIIATMLYMSDVAQYWISPTGSDANPGTAISPKQSSEVYMMRAVGGISISGTTMTAAVPVNIGLWQSGMDVTGVNVSVPTKIVRQLTGTAGLAGTYEVSPSQTAAFAVGFGDFTGRAMLHERGKAHSRPGYASGGWNADRLLVGAYGTGPERAWLDGRVRCAPLVWTAAGGGLWKTTIPFSQAIIMNGTIHDNSVHFAYYDCRVDRLRGSRIAWKVGGADQAANQAAVLASAAAGVSAFTIGLVGNTAQDPRSVVGSFNNYEVWLALADGSNPNGADLRMSQRSGNLNPIGGILRDLTFIGARGKDHIDPVPDINRVFTMIENCVFYDGATHALTGPCNTQGNNYFINSAKTPPGASTNLSILNRAGGGGLELYTGFSWVEQDTTHTGCCYIANTVSGVYGHPGANQAFRNGYFKRLRIFNCNSAFAFDGAEISTAMFIGDLIVDSFEAGPGYLEEAGGYLEGCDTGISIGFVAGAIRIRSGYHITGIKSAANSVSLITSRAQHTMHLGEWGGFYYEARNPIGLAGGVTVDGIVFDNLAGNTLLSNNSATSTDCPIIHLYGLRDGSPVGKKGTLSNTNASGGSPNRWFLDLYLHSATKDTKGNPITTPIPCVLGDLMTSANGTNWPRKLFADSGQTFGMGDRTRAQMRTALLALSYVEGTLANPYLNVDGVTPATFYIHPETWIVNRAGRIIDVPESLK